MLLDAFSTSMHELNGAGICAAACSLTNLTTQYHSLFLAPILSSFQVDSIYRCSNWVVSNCSFCHKKIWLRGSHSKALTRTYPQRTTKPVWLAALAGSAQGSSISPRFQNVVKPLLNRALVEHYVSKQFKSGKHRESRNSCKSPWASDCHWIFLCLHRPIWPICLNDEQYQLITWHVLEKVLITKGSEQTNATLSIRWAQISNLLVFMLNKSFCDKCVVPRNNMIKLKFTKCKTFA